MEELICTVTTYCSDFRSLENQTKSLILTITSFNVKLTLFTVFILMLQTGFAARCCFWFSANVSSIEQVCPSLVDT